MANKSDEKTIRIVQGVISEVANGKEINGELANILAKKIMVALRTTGAEKATQPKRQSAFMAVPGADGETAIENVSPSRTGSVPKQASEKNAFIVGDNVGTENSKPSKKNKNKNKKDNLGNN